MKFIILISIFICSSLDAQPLAAIKADALNVDYLMNPNYGIFRSDFTSTNTLNSIWFSSKGQPLYNAGTNNCYVTNLSALLTIPGFPAPPKFPDCFCQNNYFRSSFDYRNESVLLYDCAIFPGRGTPGQIVFPTPITNMSTLILWCVYGANIGTNTFNGQDHDMFSLVYDVTGLTGCLAQLRYYDGTNGGTFGCRIESTQGALTLRTPDLLVTPTNAPAWFFTSNYVDMVAGQMYISMYNSNMVQVGTQESIACTTGNHSITKLDFLLASEQTFSDSSYIISAGIWVHAGITAPSLVDNYKMNYDNYTYVNYKDYNQQDFTLLITP